MFKYCCSYDLDEGQRCSYVSGDWDNLSCRTHLSRRLHKLSAETIYGTTGDTRGSDTNNDLTNLQSCHKLNSDGTVTQESAKTLQDLPDFHKVCDHSPQKGDSTVTLNNVADAFGQTRQESQHHSSEYVSILFEPTSTVDLVPCTTAKPHTRSEQLFATA